MSSSDDDWTMTTAPVRIVVDASFALALYIPEERTDEVLSLYASWTERRNELLAPDLWTYEITSVAYKCVCDNRLTADEARETIERILALPIHQARPADLHQRALRLACDLHLGRAYAYDAHYLAVAEMENADMWTLDKKLYNAVHARLRWVHLVGKPDTELN